MGIIYLEQEFINKNESNKFDLFTYLKAGLVGFTISLVSLMIYKPLSEKSSSPIEKILMESLLFKLRNLIFR